MHYDIYINFVLYIILFIFFTIGNKLLLTDESTN